MTKWEEYAEKITERIGWLGAGLVIFGYYLNANGYISSWLVWVIGNLCVAGYSWHKKAYSTALMSIVIAVMNIYGYLKWS
jgi:nicotinamide riboside transporter PnuC